MERVPSRCVLRRPNLRVRGDESDVRGVLALAKEELSPRPDPDAAGHRDRLYCEDHHRRIDHIGRFGGAAEFSTEAGKLFIKRDDVNFLAAQQAR